MPSHNLAAPVKPPQKQKQQKQECKEGTYSDSSSCSYLDDVSFISIMFGTLKGCLLYIPVTGGNFFAP